jgi:hypothetical protein
MRWPICRWKSPRLSGATSVVEAPADLLRKSSFFDEKRMKKMQVALHHPSRKHQRPKR